MDDMAECIAGEVLYSHVISEKEPRCEANKQGLT